MLERHGLCDRVVHTRTVQPAALWADCRVDVHELPQKVQGGDPWYASNIVVCCILTVAGRRQLTLLCEMLDVLL